MGLKNDLEADPERFRGRDRRSIAKEYGCAITYVDALCNKVLGRRPKPPSASERLVAAIKANPELLKLPQADIARAVPCCKKVVEQYFQKHGLRRKAKRAEKLRDDLKNRPEMFERGDSIHALALKYGVAPNTAFRLVARLLGSEYIVLQKDTREKVDRVKTIIAREELGAPIWKLAARFGVSVYVMHIAIAELGYRPERGGNEELKRARQARREEREFKEYGLRELYRDVPYFEHIMRKRALGIGLTGEYWERYRKLLDVKIVEEGWQTLNAMTNEAPTRDYAMRLDIQNRLRLTFGTSLPSTSVE